MSAPLHEHYEHERDVFDLAGWMVAISLCVLALAYSSRNASSAPQFESGELLTWSLVMLSSLAFAWLLARGVRRGSVRSRWMQRLTSWLLFLVAVRVATDGAGLTVALSGAFFAQGFFAERALPSRRVVLLLVLALLGTAASFAVAQDPWTLAAYFAQCATCGALLTREHGRYVRARLRARRTPLPAHAVEARATRRRAVQGALGATLIAACALLVSAELSRVLRDVGVRVPIGEDGASKARKALDGSGPAWGERLEFGGQLAGRRTDDVRALVTLRDPATREPWIDGKPRYFAVQVLDTLSDRGIDNPMLRLLPLRADGMDGRSDGWVVFRDPGENSLVEMLVEHPRHFALSGVGFVLLRREPLYAAQIERARYGEDAALAAVDSRLAESYRLLCDAQELSVRLDSAARAHHRSERFVQLPPPSPALARLSSEASRLAAGALTDRVRLERVLTYLRGFDYKLEGTERTGLEGLVEFLDKREGYCESFAAAATVMLRSLGLSTRVVTGFLGSEFDAETAQYVLRARHGHAWIEVYFEGLGWARFDPTPSSAEPSAAADARGERDELAIWSSRMLARAGDLAFSRPGAPSVGQLVVDLADAPRAWLDAVRARSVSGWIVSIALALALLGVLWARARRWSASSSGLPRGAARALRYEERLIAALRERGHGVRAAWTLREICARAREREPAQLPELRPVVAALERARFGAQDLDAAERGLVEAAIAACERMIERPSSEHPATN